ncbi:acyl-CoA--6-aminopenicillanic acid acyl-transferase [Streptomonospora sediminis]
MSDTAPASATPAAPGGPAVLSVSGCHTGMGQRIGAATRDLVAANLDSYRKRFRDQAGLDDAAVRRWGGRYRTVAADYDTAVAAMLDGLAEGAEQPPEYIYALNARTEMLYGTAYREGGCTSLAVLGSRTAGGHTLLAQNWDWHPEQGPVTFLLATRDEDGFGVLSLTEAGMLAKSGLNSAGLGVCANLLVSDADRGGDGVPYHFLLRGVLHARTMSQAHRAVLPQQRISSGNILIADAGGEAIDLEVAPGDFGHLLPRQGLITHANHFETAVAVGDLRKARSQLTLLRGERVRHLLEDALEARSVTLDGIRRALQDHYSYPDAVCRHPDPAAAPEDRFCTLYSLAMDLDARELTIAAHPACEQPPARWRLGDLAAAPPPAGTAAQQTPEAASPWIQEPAHA